MSTSFIYHAFGLQCYDYLRQDFVAGNVILSIRAKDKLVCCSSMRLLQRHQTRLFRAMGNDCSDRL